jgi:class 3 adenylate cyclase
LQGNNNCCIHFNDYRILGFSDTPTDTEQELALLAQLWSLFDDFASKHTTFTKIKTIRDSILYVSGLNQDTDADGMIEWVFEMFGLLREFNKLTGQHYRLRVGIAAGPLVAGKKSKM